MAPTHRKESQQDDPPLSKREALLLKAERVAHVGSWTWDLKSGQISWSDEFYSILGLDKSRVAPSSERFFAAIHPSDRQRIQEGSERSLRSGVPETLDFRVVRPDGETRQVRMEAAFVGDGRGNTSQVVGTVLDETESRAATELIASTLAELNEAQRIASLGSWRWDLTQNRVDWTDGMYQLFGIPDRPQPTEALFFAHVHPADVQSVRAASMRAVASGVPEQLEMRIVRNDGVARDALLRSRAIWDEAGNLSGFQGIVQDVTERRQLEQRVRHAEKMEAVSTLAGGVAHDFNNYLMILSGHAELLSKLAGDAGPMRRSLDAIAQALDGCAALTQQMLMLSRKRPSRPRVLAPADIVRRMESSLRSLLGSAIALEVEIEPQIADITADPSHFDQVLVNLAINARDSMPDGGTVRIELRNVPATAQAPARVRLTVRDSGCGIPEEFRSRIFEPFFTTKPAGKGTGLGLATVYGLVQEAGGSIIVESEPGRGSVFHVEYRCADLPVAVEVPRAGSPRGDGRRILLVEDVDAVRDVLHALLSAAGYGVISASDGEQALTLLEAGEKVDGVLTDVVMPKMGGAQLQRELRQRGFELPCLFMSGYCPEDLGPSEEDPDSVMLRKPFSTNELLRALAQLVG